MNRNIAVARAIRRALVMGAAAAASTGLPASAQDQPADDTNLGQVVVTGSRIPQPNLTSISPVTAVSSEEAKLQGITRVEDLINNLPQAVADFGGNLASGATGAATVNLRGLGSQRTLVLVNGRRLMPGDPTQNGAAAPDINQIPASLLERVEVLTGGASAVYGADAVAGVVNFIMNDDFEGVRFDGQYGFYQHKNSSSVGDIVEARGFDSPKSNVMDGYAKDLTFTLGVNTGDGRGNATVYAGYRTLSALTQAERDYSACALGSGAVFTCGGSGTSAIARFLPSDQTNGAALSNGVTLGPGNTVIPYNSTVHAYNFAPTNYFQRPDERYTAGLFAHYDISSQAQAYTEFMFMDDRTVAQIAPSGAFLGSGPGQPPFFGNYLVNCDNPYLSAALMQAICTDVGVAPTGDTLVGIGKRNVEGGNRQDDLNHTSYRAVLGVRGEVTSNWSYDIYGLYGTTLYAEHYLNDMSLARLGKALTAVDDGSGNIVCRVNADADLSNDDAKCVPYNIFQLNGVTPQALNYIQMPGLLEGSTTERVVSAALTGDLGQNGVKTPWATDGLGVAFGAEYRREDSRLTADAAYQTGDLLGQGAPTLNTVGGFDVKEAFFEARMPLLQDQAFARVLSVEGGYRYSDYSLGFKTDTYKFGADWAPVEDIRFRGSYQRAVRAPNVQELFLQERVQLDGTTDPCANDPETGVPQASLAECANSGVTPTQYGNILGNPAAQYNGLVGGNPNLDPESSDTVSFGFVFTPRFLNGFSLSVDYYDIKVENLIGQLGADLIINNCLASGDAAFCDLVNRSPSGSLWLGSSGYIIDPVVNTGSLQAKGVDLESNYRFDLGGNAGRLSLQLIGTFVEGLVAEPLTGSPTYDCAGLYGTVCGVPTPEWRHKLRATWSTPWNLDLSLSWRFIDSVALDSTSSNPQLAGAVQRTDAKLKAMNYLDLSGSYSFGSSLEFAQNMTIRVGINNLTDADPPLVGQGNIPPVFGSGNTFPQVYDSLGRYGFINITADF